MKTKTTEETRAEWRRSVDVLTVGGAAMADFIDDLDDALARVGELERERDKWRDVHAKLLDRVGHNSERCADMPSLEAERDHLRAEVERLRAALERIDDDALFDTGHELREVARSALAASPGAVAKTSEDGTPADGTSNAARVGFPASTGAPSDSPHAEAPTEHGTLRGDAPAACRVKFGAARDGIVCERGISGCVAHSAADDAAERVAREWCDSRLEDGHDMSSSLAALLRSDPLGLRQAGRQEWGDRDDEWTPQIDAAFPTRSGSHDEYATAMRMVSARHSKHALVALVNWLLVRIRALAASETKGGRE